MPFARILLVGFLLLALPCTAAAEALRHGQGLLWQVLYEAKPVAHIFGTMHTADPDVLDLPAPVAHAFRAAPSLSVEVILDDYDESVVALREEHRKKLRYSCAACKPVASRSPLPCLAACAPEALRHSW